MRATIEPDSKVAVAHLLTAAPDCDREELRVVAAACLLGDVIYARPPPARHHTIIHMLSGRGLGRGEQGFLINNGRRITPIRHRGGVGLWTPAPALTQQLRAAWVAAGG